MSSIRTLCEQIREQQAALRMKTPASLLPGLTGTQIRQAVRRLPFRLPQSVIELYKWSAGLRPEAGIGNEFFPGYGMDSLREMVEMYHLLSSESDRPRFQDGA